MFRFLSTVVVAGLLGGTLVASPAPAAGPPNRKVGIDILNVTGSGCRHGTVAVSMSADNEAFTVTFSGYLAQAGNGVADGRKDCRIKLRVHGVDGVSHSISSVDHRGFAILAPGARAEQLASYYFQGSGRTPDARHAFAGPYDANWQATDRADPATIGFGPCGAARNLNIGTELLVTAGRTDPAAISMIGMDSTDSELTTTFRLAWRAC